MKQLRERILALGMAICLCLSLCAVPVSAVNTEEMPVEGNNTYGEYGEIGEIDLSLTLRKSGDVYTANYTAETTMVDWLAQAAAVCKDDPRMEKLRFTCTLHDALTEKLDRGDINKDSYDFTSAKFPADVGEKIFVLVDDDEAADAVKVESGSIKLRYKLKPEVLQSKAWKEAGTETVKDALQKLMSMEATKTVSADIVDAVKDTLKKEGTTADIVITMSDGSNIPFYGEKDVTAAEGVCFAEISTSGSGDGGSGGGGGTTTTPTIEVKDSTPDTGAASDIPTAGGTTTVVSIYAKPGDEVTITTNSNPGSMVDHITVTDGEGNHIPLTYGGGGVYTFDMPEDGDAVVDVTYRVIPADPDETGVSELLNTDDHALYMIGDDLGNFRPNASITRAEVATAFFRLLRNQDVARTMHFDDVEMTDWYIQPIEILASLDILEGVGNGDFEPDRAITRAEFAAIASRFTKKHFSGASFTDVDASAWYADAISTAAHFGWINGMGNGTFEPDRPITRTEAAAIINRMLLRISDWIDVDAGAGRHFPDVSMDFWGRYEISEATNGHDHTLEEKYFYEDWLAENWREAVDNDPVNFGQPKF